MLDRLQTVQRFCTEVPRGMKRPSTGSVRTVIIEPPFVVTSYPFVVSQVPFVVSLSNHGHRGAGLIPIASSGRLASGSAPAYADSKGRLT